MSPGGEYRKVLHVPVRLYEEVRGRRGAAVHFARIVLQAVDVGAQAGKAFLRKFVHARGKEAELVFPRVEDAALFVEELVHGAPAMARASVASNSFQTESLAN